MGAFPLLTGYVAQAGRLDVAAVIAAFGAFALSYTQRTLSTPARLIRRHVNQVDGASASTTGRFDNSDAARRWRHSRLLCVGFRAIVALAIALVIAPHLVNPTLPGPWL